MPDGGHFYFRLVQSVSKKIKSSAFNGLLSAWHNLCKGVCDGYPRNQKKRSMNLIDSNHSKMLGQAMDAYSLRQKITAANIANADTPGYNKRSVSFESELQNAQQSQGVAGMKNVTPTIIETSEKVILEDEMIEMTDTQIRVQMVARSLRHHFSLLKNSITGINR